MQVPLCVLATLWALTPDKAHGEEYFNINALENLSGSPEDIDLSIFMEGDQQPPGRYWVDIYLNRERVDSGNVDFVLVNNKLLPKLTVKQLKDMGVNIDIFPALAALPPETEITDLAKYITSSSSSFDFNKQQLDISIPQAAMSIKVKDYVPPKLWQQGLTSLQVNYSYSGSTNWIDNHSGSDSNNFLNLRSGVNWKAWRLRNYSTYSSQNNKWQSLSTYLQRDIHSLKSQLVLGDSYTPSPIFDGFQFRGMQLMSDDNMLPESLRGFAPTIRGIAQSNAQVTIKQNGYTIYETYVSPGPFVINDLYPTTSSGNLEIIVKEADGTERRSVQPFSALPVMLREDNLRHSLAIGKYQSSNHRGKEPYFMQGTVTYGLSNSVTLYGGTTFSKNYQSAALGTGYSLSDWGSLSFDVTHARSELTSKSYISGQSYRFQYAKDLLRTGTNFTVAGYRYSTRNFYDFREANEFDITENSHYASNKRNKLQLYINQSLGDFGGVYLSAYQQDYWSQTGNERNITAGYNTSYHSVNYSLNYSYSKMPGAANNDQILSLNLQIPLDRWLKNSWVSYSLTNNKQGDASHQVSLSGTALEDNNLSYSIQQNYANHNTGAGGSINADYKGAYGQVNAGYRYDKQSKQLNYGLNGGIVAHPYGITLSQSLGDTLVLVRANGAKGVKIQNYTGITTDWRGYAIIPYASSYRKNRISLDTYSMGDNVDVDVSTQTTVPTQGALTLADFQTRIGYRALLTLSYQGNKIPFGATATLVQPDENSEPNSTIVSNDGQVYFSGIPESGQIWVKWGHKEAQECRVNYQLPEKIPESGLYTLNAVCE
ncbi:MAG: fimbrial biogenesis outer membrane usher protein [Enterobacteriaceae bacterium]|nr:fimbrial biogenesis outer membrane usher protein [Enterobacteriaceae bacterium]